MNHIEGVSSRATTPEPNYHNLSSRGVLCFSFYISYIENHAYFKFGGIGGISLCFKFFPAASIILSLVFSFYCLCVLVAFMCFYFLGYFFIFRMFFVFG